MNIYDFAGNQYTFEKTAAQIQDNVILLSTGISEYTNKMNIYDFAGNECEWTLEKSYDPCTSRGGYYYLKGSNGPASDRDYNSTTFSNNCIGFRSALYK